MASSKIDYETIFQNAPVGMCISQNRIIQACNAALGLMFGYAPEALVGQSFLVLYPTHDDFERTGARGSGLGLSIVRAVCDAHGGTVKVVAQSGGGLEVTVNLPAADAASTGENSAR